MLQGTRKSDKSFYNREKRCEMSNYGEPVDQKGDAGNYAGTPKRTELSNNHET